LGGLSHFFERHPFVAVAGCLHEIHVFGGFLSQFKIKLLMISIFGLETPTNFAVWFYFS
jgi:hypothetical protein